MLLRTKTSKTFKASRDLKKAWNELPWETVRNRWTVSLTDSRSALKKKAHALDINKAVIDASPRCPRPGLLILQSIYSMPRIAFFHIFTIVGMSGSGKLCANLFHMLRP
jgi:hypothetical protein